MKDKEKLNPQFTAVESMPDEPKDEQKKTIVYVEPENYFPEEIRKIFETEEQSEEDE